MIRRLAMPDSPFELVGRRPWTGNEGLLELGRGRRLPYPERGAQHPVRLLNRLLAIGLDADIVHHTYYFRSHLSLIPNARVRAVTVYDMIPELFPDIAPGTHRAKRQYVESADLVFCISETTRDDLLQVYGEVKGRVVVTRLGVGPVFQPGPERLDGLPGSYVLFVGLRDGYKSFDVLAEAMARLPVEFHLVAVGGGPFSDTETQRLEELGIRSRTSRVSLSEPDLARAYAHAAAFVFPSLYEGFGLPTLEAMASGCPVILADAPTHREVGGDAALYFAPNDADGLAQQLAVVVDGGAAREGLIAAGLTRATEFTWDRTTELTVEAYLAAIEDSRVR